MTDATTPVMLARVTHVPGLEDMVLLPLAVPDGCKPTDSPPVKLRCPICRHQGIFSAIGAQDLRWSQHDTDKGKKSNVVHNFQVGVRRCPGRDCLAPVFVILKQGELVTSYPPEVLDFDTTNIPPVIAETMGEAVKCHASECFKAAAIMVRRTLEEISSDRGATGTNLKARIKDLGNKIVMSKELLDAANELRILGNDGNYHLDIVQHNR